MNYHPYGPCSRCSDPHHCANNYPSWGQFYNFPYEQMNTNFSSPRYDSNSNFYNPNWSNHSNFSWQAQAMGNYAPQFQELHHSEYPQFDDQSSHPSSHNYPASSSQSTLEDSLKAFMQFTSQTINEMKNATLENTRAIARIEGQLEYLAAEVTRIKEEELQGQVMAEGHYMIDEDDFNNLHQEHVQATATFESEEIVDGNEEEEKEEHLEHTTPLPDPNMSTDKEMSTEAHSFITIPLETFHEPRVSVLQCLQMPSSTKSLKDRCTQEQKSRNHRLTKILRSTQVGHLRRRHIFSEGYQILKKKGWKGLVGHPRDRGRRCEFSFPFYFLYI
jgi:hypothetical protein